MAPSDFVIEHMLESEIDQYVALRNLVFAPTINKILYSKQHTPSQETLNRVANDIRDGMRKNQTYLLCREKATGNVVAAARYRWMGPSDPSASERSEEDVEKDLVIPPPYLESDVAVWDDVFAMFGKGKREIMGRECYYVLDTLVTHPEHHRRGAGGLLVGKGCEWADEKGVAMYLEASPMGAPLYARFGFESQRLMKLDMAKHGYEYVFDFIAMKRPAKGSA
jgi:GNAT superfamily N-acetyltransferase